MKILYLALVDWFSIKQRPQFIAQGLSKNQRVYYVGRRLWRKNLVVREQNDTISGNLKILRLFDLPAGRLEPVRKVIHLVYREIFRLTDKLKDFEVIWLTHPLQWTYIPCSSFEQKLVVYDNMDYYVNFTNDLKLKAQIRQYEQELVDYAKVIFVSSQQLKSNLINDYGVTAEKIHIVNNGVDNKLLRQGLATIENIEPKKYRVGYLGMVAPWFDFELVGRYAQRHSELVFEIVGPVSPDSKADLDNLLKSSDNIYWQGPVPHSEVAKYIERFDVCLMPFRSSNLVDAVNPVKIYEYLAFGKPTVATLTMETEQFNEYIYTYSSPKEFEQALDRALRESDSKLARRRYAFSKENSWEKRVLEIERILRSCF